MKNNKNILSIEENNIAIVLKEGHILMYDLEPSTKEIRPETEGILNKINSELYETIAAHFGVDLKEYGVDEHEESLEIEI